MNVRDPVIHISSKRLVHGREWLYHIAAHPVLYSHYV